MFNQGSGDDSKNDIPVDNEANNPTDTISCIKWMPGTNNNILACGSWDGKLRFYDIIANQYNKPILTLKGAMDCMPPGNNTNARPVPILSCAWKTDGSVVFFGGCDGFVRAVDLNSSQVAVVAKHDRPVKEMFWIDGLNVLMTLGLDKMLCFWNLQSDQPQAKYDVGYKIYAADFNYANQSSPLLLMGTSDERVILQDLSKFGGNFQKFDFIESPLGAGSQITCVSLFPSGKGLGMGSFDGRANLSTIMKDYSDRFKLDNIMTFKCHKVDKDAGYNNKQQLLYPVHGIGFHPRADKFVFTAGGEGIINYWDYGAKNKIKQFSFNEVPVTACKLNDSGQLAAYGLGYDWSRGIEGLFQSPRPRLMVHVMQDNELKYVEQPSGTGGQKYFK